MEDDIKDWISIAEDNLATAEILYQNERFKDACYYCQQVAEKALKAVQIAKLKRYDKIHFLPDLAESVKAPKSISIFAKRLTTYYINSRYPLPEHVAATEKETEDAISGCREVLEWAKSTLKL